MAHDDLLKEQTRRLFASMPVMNMLEPVWALIIVWLYWSASTPRMELLTCGTLIFGMAFTRIVVGLLFRHLAPDMQRTDGWRWIATLLIWISGAIMGLVAVYLNPTALVFAPTLMPYQALFAGLMLSLSVIALSTYSSYLPAALGYLLAMTVPVAIHVARSAGDDGLIFGAVFTCVSLFLMLATITMHRGSVQNLRLQYKNLSLIDYLDRARADAEALNEKLTREIFERKQAKQNLQEANDRLETIVQERTRLLETANGELSAASQRLQLALDASSIGLWDWNLQTGETYHSNFDRLLGYGRDRFSNFVVDMEQLVHGEDWPKIKRAMVAHFKGRTSRYHAVYRIRHANGEWRW
ncbi:MAG: PAS domain-containing protein, partial [Alcanivorax sp.]|nr:PAS domain-containing protein [Alcanivorax sp.]